MTTPVWLAGHLYVHGDLVRPVTQPVATSTAITNASFETGDATGWTLGAGMAIDSGDAYAGTYRVECTGTGGSTDLVHDAVAVSPGRSITASCMYQQGSASAGNNVGCVFLRWYTSGMVQIGTDAKGNIVSSGSGGAYNLSTVTAVAPATAAFVAIGGNAVRDNAASSAFDQFTWNYAASTLPPGLIYKSVQVDPATSGANEPAWPVSVGLTVVDGGVTWEAVQTSRVVWEASPILVSGAVEPAWPTVPGEFVSDGTISWECVSRRVEDENCPNTAVVLIVASKVFAADGDIVRYSATANPLDWSTEDDAGYLPTGLQQANANDIAVANQYRGNAVFFNASSFQNWQADPDPAAMAILDQMDGVGSVHQKAAQPVANDLFYLASLGVRSIGIANATENLAAGDVGMPIDTLVTNAVSAATAIGLSGLATYYPSAGQYWLSFSDTPSVPVGDTLVLECAPGDAIEGSPYSYTYIATGGTLPYTFSVVSGALPDGLTLNSATGELSGTPTTQGAYSFAISVTDAAGVIAYCGSGADPGEDEIVVHPPVEWMITYGQPIGDNTSVKISPDGEDWSAAGLLPAGVWNPGNARFARNGANEILITTTTGTPRAVYSSDGGATWVSADGGWGGNATDAVCAGGYWYIGGVRAPVGATPVWSAVPGSVVDGAWGTLGTRVVCSDPGGSTFYQKFWTSDDHVTFTDRGTLGHPDNITVVGMASGDGVLGLVGHLTDSNGDYELVLMSTTTANSGSWQVLSHPFSPNPSGSFGGTCIHYDALMGLWLVSFFDQIAYGPTLDDLTLSAHSFPADIFGIGSDGVKAIVVGGDAMMARTFDGETWTPITLGVPDTAILDVIALGGLNG